MVTYGPSVTPATTCALVSTCWGEMTKPEPSICFEQLGATPMILTMLSRARARPAELSTEVSGGRRVSALSAPSALNTWV